MIPWPLALPCPCPASISGDHLEERRHIARDEHEVSISPPRRSAMGTAYPAAAASHAIVLRKHSTGPRPGRLPQLAISFTHTASFGVDRHSACPRSISPQHAWDRQECMSIPKSQENHSVPEPGQSKITTAARIRVVAAST